MACKRSNLQLQNHLQSLLALDNKSFKTKGHYEQAMNSIAQDAIDNCAFVRKHVMAYQKEKRENQ